MTLSKPFHKVYGSGLETARVLYNLIAEVEAKTPDNKIKTVEVTIAPSGTSGASTADATLIDGKLLGFVPNGADVAVKKIELGATGIITVTLGSASTAGFKVAVTVLKK